MQKLIDIESQLNKSELALTTRFANLIKGNEVDLEMFDRLFRNVEDANALAILKNQLAEIANVPSLAIAPEKTKRNYPEKRKTPKKQVPMSVMAEKKKESDKDIKQNVQDLGKPVIDKDEDTFDL